MSLRGSETTEAISRRVDCVEIAAFTSFARNDKEESWHSLLTVLRLSVLVDTVNAARVTENKNVP